MSKQSLVSFLRLAVIIVNAPFAVYLLSLALGFFANEQYMWFGFMSFSALYNVYGFVRNTMIFLGDIKQ